MCSLSSAARFHVSAKNNLRLPQLNLHVKSSCPCQKATSKPYCEGPQEGM